MIIRQLSQTDSFCFVLKFSFSIFYFFTSSELYVLE